MRYKQSLLYLPCGEILAKVRFGKLDFLKLNSRLNPQSVNDPGLGNCTQLGGKRTKSVLVQK